MKLALYNDYRPALMRDDGLVDISDAVKDVMGRNGQETMEGIIADFERLRPALQKLQQEGTAIPLAQVQLRSPLPRPGKIMMMGTNYLEFTKATPLPIFGFFKSPEAILDPGGICHRTTSTSATTRRRCRWS